MRLLGLRAFLVCIHDYNDNNVLLSHDWLHLLPLGVFFMYDLSPMLVQMTEHRRSLAHFLTGVCAIIGGVFTVAGMLDGMLYHSTRALKKKIDLGKAS